MAEYALVVNYQFSTSFDSLLGLGHLGEGRIVRGTITSLSGLTGSSTQAGTGRTNLQLIGISVADCQALT